MWQIEYEEAIIREMLSDGDAFLFSDVIYWQLNLSSKDFSPTQRRLRISAGRLLISIMLLKHYKEDGREVILTQLLERINKWSANWQKKVARELPVRIRQWNQLITDLRVDSDFSQPQMNNQLQIRLMIGLLLDELTAMEREKFLPLTENLDNRYKNLTVGNGFVWNNELIEIFPSDKFWYLYRKLGQPGGIK